MLKGVVNVVKFIDYCFQWESPLISFFAFMVGELFCRIRLIKILFIVIIGYRLEF
jgi:hypothetical protein